jgi:LmbE family N-acetylglucosaminyl deacetylase
MKNARSHSFLPGKILRPIADKINPLFMRKPDARSRARVALRGAVAVALALGLAAALWAQAGDKRSSPLEPLPQDSGPLGLQQMLLRLHTTARLLHTTAHPDDEDGGMLTLESRGKGVTAILLTLNRGEGGQNKVGSNLSDVLGVLRTLELTASDRYYGVEQRFTRVADFGFSKSADETLQKWQGHDMALGDMVRVIRTFRPDVIVSRFGGTARDGHGNHQVSGIVSREAFRAAADPNRFSEQIQEGLLPWQAKKLYIDNVCPFRSNECPDGNYTVKLATGELNPALGMTYIQFAMQGLRHQLSQGAGGWSVDAGPHYAFYRLVDSVLPKTTDESGHEKDFLDGIDTSLPALAARLGSDESTVPFLKPALLEVAGFIDEASKKAGKDGYGAVGPLSAAAEKLSSLIEQIDSSGLSSSQKQELLAILQEKQQQAEAAIQFALGVSVEATVAPPAGPGAPLPKEEDALTVVSPGQQLMIVVKLHNGSKFNLAVGNVALDAPAGWVQRSYRGESYPVRPEEDFYANFQVRVSANAPYTRPYWHRSDPEVESVNHVDDERFATLALPPPLLHVRVSYQVRSEEKQKLSLFGLYRKSEGGLGPGSTTYATVVVPFLDAGGARQERVLAIAPAFSVMLEPGEQVIPVEGASGSHVTVGVSYNLSAPAEGVLRLELPQGWRAEPAAAPVRFTQRGEKHDFQFTVFPGNLQQGRAQVHAILESGGQRFTEGYSLVSREDLAAFYYYQPAVQRVSIVDVKVPPGLKVGYIMGAGDDIPTVLKQVGMDVTLIPAERLASEDLSKYGTIVLGIRAYDTQKDVIANNKKLLDYVAAGGTLVVQYETSTGEFNSGHFTPYPAQLSRARVSVEEAPVTILAPDDPVFHYPNQITQKDFDGWVQERGLYFMDQWDDHFKPLLSCHDPGEEAQRGGLLRAPYGKGTYIYAAYAFFRQLPAGVPGAIRLYVNLLSAGREGSQ